MALALLIKYTVGTLFTYSALAIYDNSSIFSFTNFHFPLAFFAFSSKSGVNFLQGLHQSA